MTTYPANPQPYAPPAALPPRGRGNRVVAFVLSLIAVGVGQYYLGRPRRAAIWLAVIALGMPIVAAVFPAASRAGLFSIVAALGLLIILSRIFSAADALFITPGAERPPAPLVALAAVGVLILLVGSSLLARRFLLEAFRLPSSSMIPSLQVGDHVFIDKKITTPRRGQILVFAFPENKKEDFIKRVIGIGGDRIEMRDGHPYINGWEVPHCRVGRGTAPKGGSDSEPIEGDVFVEYLDGEAYLTFLDDGVPRSAKEGPWSVKPGEAFVLGDNRENSHDSRRWYDGAGGGVPRENVHGEAIVVWLSAGATGIEWSRIGQRVTKPVLPRSMRALTPALDRCLASRPPQEATVPPSLP